MISIKIKSINSLFFYQDLWDMGGGGAPFQKYVAVEHVDIPYQALEQFKAVKKEKACIHLWGKNNYKKKNVLHSLKINGQTFHQEFLTKESDSVADLSPSSTGLWSE